MIDFARGAGGFPVTGEFPATRDEFVRSLEAGYRARVQLDSSLDVQPVTALGENFPNLDALVINLDGATIRSDYRPTTFRAAGRLRRDVMHVQFLSYNASPLHYVDGRTNLRISAHDVSLGLLRGRDQQSALVMTEAKNGTVDFEVEFEDARSMIFAAMKSAGEKAGYRVSDVKVHFACDDSRSLEGAASVRGWWLLLPTSFTITARIDIDDEFNAHVSRIACRGEDVGGVLVAGFIDGALKKYDGRVMPLAGFPGGKIKIRDLQISADDALRVFVAFSS